MSLTFNMANNNTELTVTNEIEPNKSSEIA